MGEPVGQQSPEIEFFEVSNLDMASDTHRGDPATGIDDLLLGEGQVSPLVLVADDERYAQQLLQRVLEREGFRTITVSDGHTAIETARNLRPDLIMMDIQMPGIDGFQAVELLRQDSRTERIPIIVVTAAAREPSDAARGIGLGADDYLRKPFNTAELVARARSKIRAYHLEERLQQRTNELEALVRIGAELNQGLALDELADHILSAVLEQLPASNAALILVNPEEKPTLSRFCGWGNAGPSAGCLLAASTLPGYVLQCGEAALVCDASSDTLIPAIFDGSPCVAGVAAPLIHQSQTMGVLALGDTTPGHFSDADLRLLRSIAQEAALAIRNAQLYTELRDYAQNLEAMVEARTAALQSAQAQLFRTEKLAALGTLAAGIAHEVNNPLQPILTNLEMALEDHDANRPPDRELLDFAKRDVQRIQGIVSRLLDFARPTRRDLKPEDLVAVDLNAIVREVLILAGKQLEHARIKVETQLTAARCIRGNTDQLKQVILNLVVNAMEAMPDGGFLTICTDEQDEQLVLSVQDTGVGIRSDELPRLFDPFFTTKPDGTGLGLSVSYGIITDHGGQIEVDSAPGQHTRFIIRLPIMADDRG